MAETSNKEEANKQRAIEILMGKVPLSYEEAKTTVENAIPLHFAESDRGTATNEWAIEQLMGMMVLSYEEAKAAIESSIRLHSTELIVNLPADLIVPSPPQSPQPTRKIFKSDRGGPRSTPRVGRNSPCPCGSGLKYKKCCNDTHRS